MLQQILAEITETKTTLLGVEKIYRCRLITRAAGAAVVIFVSDAAIRVANLTLPAGTVTFGYFWEDRPYNVYHWMAPGGATLGHYFNLADRTQIADGTLTWRDLAIDVLVRPGAPPAVLDEDEVPADLDAATQATIAAARSTIIRDADKIIGALESSSRTLWPRVFGQARP